MQERRFVNACVLSKLSHGKNPDVWGFLVFFFSGIFSSSVAVLQFFPLYFSGYVQGYFKKKGKAAELPLGV